jgi:anti-sigma B factor antagonist
MTETKIHQVEPGITVLEIAGRLTLGNSLSSIEVAIKQMISEGARKLVIDLSRTSYMDSAAVGMLVACTGEMHQNGGRLRIAGAQERVARTLDIVHMERITPVDADLETSCRYLSVGSAAG